MPGVIAFLAGLAARFLGVGIIRWLATKALLAGLLTIVLPIVLNNFMYAMLQKYFGLMSEQLQVNLPGGPSGPLAGGQPFMLQLSGLAAWIAVKIHLPEALSYVLSASAARLAMNFIPFFRA